MERYRELEKAFKKKQFSQRSTRPSGLRFKGGAAANGDRAGPICKKRMAMDSDDENSPNEDDFSDDEDDEYSHGSDCNCGGDDLGDDDDLEGDYGAEEEDANDTLEVALSTEDAMICLKQAQDFIVTQIAKLD